MPVRCVFPSWCRSMRRAVSSCRSPACWLLAINKWRSNTILLVSFDLLWSLWSLSFYMIHAIRLVAHRLRELCGLHQVAGSRWSL